MPTNAFSDLKTGVATVARSREFRILAARIGSSCHHLTQTAKCPARMEATYRKYSPSDIGTRRVVARGEDATMSSVPSQLPNSKSRRVPLSVWEVPKLLKSVHNYWKTSLPKAEMEPAGAAANATRNRLKSRRWDHVRPSLFAQYATWLASCPESIGVTRPSLPR